MRCWLFYARFKKTRSSDKFHLLLISAQNIFPKVVQMWDLYSSALWWLRLFCTGFQPSPCLRIFCTTESEMPCQCLSWSVVCKPVIHFTAKSWSSSCNPSSFTAPLCGVLKLEHTEARQYALNSTCCGYSIHEITGCTVWTIYNKQPSTFQTV